MQVNIKLIKINSNINQLLLIPCVILDFLCIHPFRDVSATTVEAILGSMVKDGSIIIIGSGRNTKYIRNDKG